jgi:hypothetical protein
MSELLKIPESKKPEPRSRKRDRFGLVMMGFFWIVIFAYGVYIKTV